MKPNKIDTQRRIKDVWTFNILLPCYSLSTTNYIVLLSIVPMYLVEVAAGVITVWILQQQGQTLLAVLAVGFFMFIQVRCSEHARNIIYRSCLYARSLLKLEKISHRAHGLLSVVRVNAFHNIKCDIHPTTLAILRIQASPTDTMDSIGCCAYCAQHLDIESSTSISL